MLTLKKVAVTGGLASGKTLVCSLLKELGAYVVSADQIVHQLLSPDTCLGKKIINLLGSDIVRDTKFDKRIIANKVFSNQSLLRKYEALIHPSVIQEIENEYQHAREKKYKLFIAEVPLLFEGGLENLFDETVVVAASEQTRCNRFLQRDGASFNNFYERQSMQMPVEKKIQKANQVLFNDEGIESLKLKTMHLFNQLVADKE
jgi:dephospho-CoA kinase